MECEVHVDNTCPVAVGVDGKYNAVVFFQVGTVQMISDTAVSISGIVGVGRRAGRPFPGECGELQFDAAFAGNGLFRTEGHASCAGMTPSLCTCRAGERSALQDLLFPSVGFERVFNIQGEGLMYQSAFVELSFQFGVLGQTCLTVCGNTAER